MKQDKEQTETFERLIDDFIFGTKLYKNVGNKLKELHEQERDFLIAKLSNKLDIIKEKDKQIIAIKDAWNKLMDKTDDLHNLNCGSCDDDVIEFERVLNNGK